MQKQIVLKKKSFVITYIQESGSYNRPRRRGKSPHRHPLKHSGSRGSEASLQLRETTPTHCDMKS